MRYAIKVDAPTGCLAERVVDTDDLLGVISGQLSSLTILIDPTDPLSAKVTISRIGDGE